MRVRPGVILASSTIILVGLITLLGVLFGSNLTLAQEAGGEIVSVVLIFLARLFVQIATVTIALSVVVGVLNLLVVHINRFYRGHGSFLNRLNSLVLVLVYVLTVSIWIIERWQGTPATASLSRLLLEDVQIAIESSLAALLFFTLVYGAYRLLQRQLSFYRVLFVAAVLVVLMGSLALPGLAAMAALSDWLLSVPVSAGARGILLGIALATVVTGVRVLIGQDRSYH
ncbi:MAG: hypothetical protein MUE40_19000 [Anaerolineae bacterium]|jgi:hypothetical protein|nr:hypothetical protein [Anaerolineae bacterium]